MKALVQRVSEAKVTVEGKTISEIGVGLLVLLGVQTGDTAESVSALTKKLLALRVFPDAHRDINRSVVEVKGEILLVSQFTLLARTDKGNRPSFVDAAPPELANKLYEQMKKELTKVVPVQTGEFGTYMHVELVNDGPVTLMLEV